MLLVPPLFLYAYKLVIHNPGITTVVNNAPGCVTKLAIVIGLVLMLFVTMSVLVL